MKKPNISKPVLNKLMILILVFTLLLVIFTTTNPNNISLAILLVPFLLIGYMTYLIVSLLLRLNPRMRDTGGVLPRLIALAGAFFVVALLLLASLGQLTLRDSLLVAGFTVLFVIYANRADFLK